MFKNIERRYILAGICIGILLFIGVLSNLPLKSRATNGTLSFAATNYSPGSNGNPIVSTKGSFNSATDALPDLAVVNSSGDISIYTGNADGTFTAGTTLLYGHNQNIHSITTGDFNEDGKTDLVFTDDISGYLTLEGDGTGNFISNTSGGLGGGAVGESITTGDFGNGHADLAIADNLGRVSIIMGDGTGTFSNTGAIDVNAGIVLTSIVAGNFRSGHIDLAIADVSGLINILTNDGTGVFTLDGTPAYTSGFSIPNLITADLGDGFADLIAVESGDNAVIVIFGNGGSNLHTYFPSLPGGDALTSVTAVDVNHDSKLDLAVADDISGQINILTGDGTGTFTVGSAIDVGISGPSIISGDFNGDAYGDLVVANNAHNAASVLINTMNFADSYTITGATVGVLNTQSQNFTVTPNGTVTGDITIAVSGGGLSSPTNDVVLSFNNSSTPQTFTITPTAVGDVTLTATNNVSLADPTDPITYHTYRLAFSGPTDYSLSSISSNAMASGFFNSDTDVTPDFAVANSDGTVSIFLGTTNGTLTTGQVLTVDAGHSITAIVSGSFNPDTDSKTDLAVTSSNGSMYILTGDGTGTFTVHSSVAVGNRPLSITAGNFNSGSDSFTDLAVANSSSNNVSIVLSAGDGTFTPASTPVVSVGTTPESIVSGDLDEDGFIDLIVADYDSGMLSILLGNNDGTFDAGSDVVITESPSTTSVALGDFNADGHLDVVATDTVNSTVAIFLGVGNGHFTTAPIPAISVPTSSSFVTTGDVNGDGNIDLLVTSMTNNAISIMLGDGAGYFSMVYGMDVVAGPVHLLTEDVNGDGVTDLLSLNSTSQNVAVFIGALNDTATSYTIDGPSSGLVNQTSSDFTITPNGVFSGTITVTFSGGGITDPLSFYFASSSTPQTFSITPSAIGTVSIDSTNDGIMSDPTTIEYTVSNPPPIDGGGAPTIGAVEQATKDEIALLHPEIVVTNDTNTHNENTPTTDTGTVTIPDTTLKFGDRGDDVKELQKALNLVNYHTTTPADATNNVATLTTDSPTPLVVDGIFGRITRSVVLFFQKAYSLVTDGVVGAKTRAMIHSILAI